MTRSTCIPEDETGYDDYLENMRLEQYPMLNDAIYLDAASMPLCSKMHLDRFHTEMMSVLLGNPHSASPSSQRATREVENVRLQLLQFFKADPEHFDLVFTANATAAIKLVMEAFRGHELGFWYGYHVDCHTSLIGVRECAKKHHCFETDCAVESFLDGIQPQLEEPSLRLFAWPAQSNMNGRRLPREWSGRLRTGPHSTAYSLLDAAAYASTSPLDLSDASSAPDFTVVSLYKIFGFPDLGALIVRKEAAHLFQSRKYFGGGTVDMVLCVQEQWHATKTGNLHEQLEDGTLPVHSIIALKSAMITHEELYGSLDRISIHTAALAKQLRAGLLSLQHANGAAVCILYGENAGFAPEWQDSQGPVVAFNVVDENGRWISNAEFEKLTTVRDVHIRTGGMCNPGGVAQALDLAPWEMKANFSAGQRCGGDSEGTNEKPTGIIRASLGATSTRRDVMRFLAFVDEFFAIRLVQPLKPQRPLTFESLHSHRFHVESLTIYPIKSCSGWQVPDEHAWPINSEGLAWDREWCIVHQGTGKALSQKQYPRMALVRPQLDFKTGTLRVHASDNLATISIPLSNDPSVFVESLTIGRSANVCGDAIDTRLYTSHAIAAFFTQAIGVPCTLARFPPAGTHSPSSRHAKSHLKLPAGGRTHPILLSNESPILTISRSSLNRLNEQIKEKGGKAALPSVFRANIVLAESAMLPPGQEQPWKEDDWQSMRVGGENGPVLDFLGGCRRCQMVSIDQVSGERNQEPFVTLAKTRRRDGRILFGVHTALALESSGHMIRAGDAVEAS